MNPQLLPVLLASTDPDVAAWLARVAAASGTVSPGTKAAVSRFVRALKGAGLWSMFRRLNLCCGDFAASFVPLVNTSGGTADTNVGLLSSDYSEALGWQTDGSTKYVNTGYTPSEATGDLSVYLRTTQASVATGRFILGTSAAAGAQMFAIRANRTSNNTTTAGAVSGLWGGVNTGPTPDTTGGGVAGLWQITRRGATDAELYLNGASKSTSASATTPATAGNAVYVFGLNNAGLGTAGYCEANTRISGYSASTGMTTAQSLAYYTAMQAFQTELGRQV